VVGAPTPDVVDQGVVGGDDQAVGGLPGDVAADPDAVKRRPRPRLKIIDDGGYRL